jgi:hypothetical protein
MMFIIYKKYLNTNLYIIVMLFRNTEGELIEIRKSDYKNDLLYYRVIMNTIKSSTQDKKEISQMEYIISKIKNISNK